MEETRHEGKSSLSRLTSSMENSFLPTAYRFLECQEKKKKNHCELSQVQSVAALPMLLGRSISNSRPRNPDCPEPAKPKC